MICIVSYCFQNFSIFFQHGYEERCNKSTDKKTTHTHVERIVEYSTGSGHYGRGLGGGGLGKVEAKRDVRFRLGG